MKVGFFKPNVEKMLAKQDVSGLTKALTDKDEDVGLRAAAALAVIGEPAVKTLIQALEDENNYVQSCVVLALERIGEPAVGPLIRTLENENPIVRGLVAKVLGEIGDKRAVKPLTQALKDEYSVVSKIAKEALEKIKAKK